MADLKITPAELGTLGRSAQPRSAVSAAWERRAGPNPASAAFRVPYKAYEANVPFFVTKPGDQCLGIFVPGCGVCPP